MRKIFAVSCLVAVGVWHQAVAEEAQCEPLPIGIDKKICECARIESENDRLRCFDRVADMRAQLEVLVEIFQSETGEEVFEIFADNIGYYD